MDASLFGTSLLAVASGVTFSLIGIAYKIGETRGLSAAQIAWVAVTLGAIAFGALAVRGEGWPPPWVWALGLAAGISQYATLRLVQVALRLGPLAALWCAMSLSFVTVVPYATVVFGRPVGWLQGLGVLAAAACVLTAARTIHRPSRGGSRTAPTEPSRQLRATYLLVLAVAAIVNGISGICISDLGLRAAREGVTYRDLYAHSYNLIFYASLGVLVFLDLLWRGQVRLTRPLLGLGVMAGVGSGLGIVTAALASQRGGSIVWAVSGASGILASAVVGTLAFGERRTRAWYATCLLGILAVALAQIKP